MADSTAVRGFRLVEPRNRSDANLARCLELLGSRGFRGRADLAPIRAELKAEQERRSPSSTT